MLHGNVPFLRILDGFVYLVAGILLHLSFVGGVTVTVATIEIRANNFANPALILIALLAVRWWMVGGPIEGFRLPFRIFPAHFRRSPTDDRSPTRQPLSTPRLRVGILAAILVGASFLAFLILPPYPRQGLEGRYYDNPVLAGAPRLITRDPGPSLTTTHGHEYSTDFSVEWTGVIYLPEAGSHRFALASDDGSALWIDDTLVVDNGGTHSAVRAEGTSALNAGFHRIRIRYVQRGGNAELAATWFPEGAAASGNPERPLADAVLFPRLPSRGSFGLFLLAQRLLQVSRLLFFVVVAAALLGTADSLLRRRREGTLGADLRALMSTTRLILAYAVEFALISVLAALLWCIVLDRFTLPLGSVEVGVGGYLEIFVALAALLVSRRVLRGSMLGGFVLPPRLTAEANRLCLAGARSFRGHWTSSVSRARLVAATAIVAVVLGGASVASRSQQGLTGRYYDGTEWSENRLRLEARDPEPSLRRALYDLVDFRVYSIEWSGVIFIPRPGTFRFIVTANAGVRLSIDDALLIEDIVTRSPERRLGGSVRLDPGFHSIRVAYAHPVDRIGRFFVNWAREGDDRGERPLSTAVSFPDAPSGGGLALFRLARLSRALASWLLLASLTVAYLLACHWLLTRLGSTLQEHHVYLALWVLVAITYWLAATGQLVGWWGFAQLERRFELEQAIIVLLFVIVAMLVAHHHRTRIHAAAQAVEDFLRARPVAVLAGGLAFVVLFWTLRSEFVNSDGRMLRWLIPRMASEDPRNYNFDEMLEQAVHLWFWFATNAAFGWSVRVSYQVVSVLAGGVFVLLLWSYAKRLFAVAALPFFLLMTAAGYMQLFFGDVEHYTLVATAILGYFVASALFLQGRASVVLPSAALALAMTFHMLAGFLLPSLAYAYLIAFRRRSFTSLLAGIAAFAGVVVGTMLILGEPLDAFSEGSWGMNALSSLAQAGFNGLQEPVVTDPEIATAIESRWAFPAFDEYHWDQYNLLALMFPAHLLVVPLFFAGRIRMDPINVHLMAACIGMGVFQFSYRALLPVYFDWNLYASAAIPLAILVWRNLLRADGLRYKTEIVVGWALLSYLHTYSWILYNHRFLP